MGNWLTLSSAGGSLDAGVSTSVVASVNSNANALTQGIYAGAVNFYNATNGLGNVSPTVSLTVTATTPPPPAPSGTYQIVPATYSWVDPSGHQALYLSDDSVSYTAYYLPFTFYFYGKPYSRICVGSNGLFGFSTGAMYLYQNYNLPSTTWPNAAIYPYWDNLNPAAGGSVRVGMVGSAPNRRAVISYVGVPSRYIASTTYTFQAMLCEGSNDIVFQYQNVSPNDYTYGAGAGATIGIENETGTQAAQFSYNRRSLTNGMAIRFTTQPTTSNRPGVFYRSR